METLLRGRPLRLGTRLFTTSAHWLRWGILTGVVLTFLADWRIPTAEIGGWWSLTMSIFMWFVAAAAGFKLSTNLSLRLSQGMTRREFIVSIAVFGLLSAAAMTVLATAGFVGEHALLAAVDSPVNTWGGAFVSGLRYLVVTLIYFFGGAAVAALGIRFGKHPAAFAAVIIIPVGATYAGALTIESFVPSIDAFGWTFIVWVISSAVVIAALVATYAMSLRTIPIRSKAC